MPLLEPARQATAALRKAQLHVRELLADAVRQRREQNFGDRRGAADADRPRHAIGEAGELFVNIGDPVEQLFRVLQQDLACFGERHAPAQAIEQLLTDLRLEASDMPAYRDRKSTRLNSSH